MSRIGIECKLHLVLKKSYKFNGGLIIAIHPIHPNTISILRDNRLQFNAIGLGGILLIEAIAIWNSYMYTLCVLCSQVIYMSYDNIVSTNGTSMLSYEKKRFTSK